MLVSWPNLPEGSKKIPKTREILIRDSMDKFSSTDRGLQVMKVRLSDEAAAREGRVAHRTPLYQTSTFSFAHLNRQFLVLLSCAYACTPG